MKLITVIVKSEQLPAIKDALFKSNLNHMTAMPVLGTATNTEQRTFMGTKKEIDLFERIRLDIAVKDSDSEKAIDAIVSGAKSSGGSGKILVTELQDAITIFSGARGDAAL